MEKEQGRYAPEGAPADTMPTPAPDMVRRRPLLEVCCGNMASVRAAAAAGAARIELCTSLELDGLTPDAEMLAEARRIYGGTINVLIRSRAGNFVYTPAEIALMERQIRALDADGFVIGALTPDGAVDMVAMERLMAAAEGGPVTFHRAFDVAADRTEALERIIELGCARVLTSGGALSAPAGADELCRLKRQAAGRILIMAGGGVRPSNVAELMRRGRPYEIHGSFSALCTDGTTASDPSQIAESLEIISQEYPE